MHASNDWDATTGAGWETGGGRGGGSGSGVLFAGPQVALSSAAGGSCDVPGRPDIGGAGSCFVSLCTSWSALQFRSLGAPKIAHCATVLKTAWWGPRGMGGGVKKWPSSPPCYPGICYSYSPIA